MTRRKAVPGLITSTVELEKDQIDLIIRTLQEKVDDLASVIKNPEGLSDEFLRDQHLDHRDLLSIIRELKYFAVPKKKPSKRRTGNPAGRLTRIRLGDQLSK